MMNRRNFFGISLPAVFSLPALAGNKPLIAARPLVISTWAPNVKANAAAWQILEAGGKALDAVHKGVQVPEADPEDQSVGYGGLPDRDGKVTVDSCLMDEQGNIGAVAGLENILHPISVARMVMEKTPHVMLVGDGALQFALANGFEKVNLLTEKSKRAWQEWLKTSQYDPKATINNIEERIKQNHDTIGMLALDNDGNISGACTTSGMAYKIHGRVGDSPIIGAGLYVDNKIGAATATGLGEDVVRICGSHTVVEMMRQGMSPSEACKAAIMRLIEMRGPEKVAQTQIGFIALNKAGEYGCYSLRDNFTMAIRTKEKEEVIPSPFLM